MKYLLAILLSLPFFATAAEKPNLIYILLDDAGYGDISCYGQKKFATPNIDRLAAEGMKFTDHYSGSTVCAPTRCSLMTGLHTGHTFVRGNREVQPEGQAPMPADIVTIPRLLKKAGYATGAMGKWGLGAPGSASDPAEHFDLFYGYNCQRQAHDYYPDHLWNNFEKVPLNGETYAHTPIMEQTIQFVRDHKDEPFFLYVPITIPHAAMQAPEADMAEWRKKFPEAESIVGKYAGTEVNNPVAAFAAMMTIVDNNVGELLDLLDELKIDDNTLIMFTSDNGPHVEGGHKPDFFDSNGPFTGNKRDLYEGGIRTFMIARWPGKIEAGTTSDLISAHWDVLPTLCELGGAKIPNEIDGISMVPTLLGKTDEQKKHDYLYWEFYEKGGRKAARFGKWKAVQYNINTLGEKAPIEIYDLSKDIAEQSDLSAENPKLVATAKAFFKEAHTPSPLWQFGKKPNNNNQKKAKPKAP
jgi:arylsulfatase A-like enzyme